MYKQTTTVLSQNNVVLAFTSKKNECSKKTAMFRLHIKLTHGKVKKFCKSVIKAFQTFHVITQENYK